MKKNNLIKLKKSGIHSYGSFAAVDIAEDSKIIQYVGKRITQKQADQRVEEDKHACIYLFQLNQRDVIDGDVSYNLAKYINHSCEPNCYTEIIKGEIWIMALRDIKKGEELTYNYGFSRAGWHEHPCKCGSKNCFGFIVAQEHWPAIRKTKRYQKLIKA